jgi:ACS family hexuronate transporter-like MFS transporter
MDRLGARIGLALSLSWWSIATALTSLARGALSLGALRALLGIAEPCVYPAGIKACAEFFKPSERAMAMGIFSSGSAIGAVLAPPLVAWCTLRYGWQAAFVIIGLLALCWLPVWLFIYPGRSAVKSGASFQESGQATSNSAITWRTIAKQRVVWALVLPRLFSDPVWYFYLFWLPDYLQRVRHFDLQHIALYGWLPFLFADFGNVAGGAISDWLVRKGWSQARARLAVLVSIACISPVGAFVGWMPSVSGALIVVCIVTFLTQCWSTNIATLATDLLPFSIIGSVTGMMGSAGSVGGVLFAEAIGLIIGSWGYRVAFVSAACLYPLALIALLFLMRNKPPAANMPQAVWRESLSN